MPLVTVLTATHGAAPFLDEAWASVNGSTVPPGWELEWLVQADGADPIARSRLPDDDRVRFDALGLRLGAAGTRNAALARSRGDVVAGLDHDDRLADGGLAALVLAATEDGAHWSCGRAELLLADGTRWTRPDALVPGRVEPGAVGRHVVETGDFPVTAGFSCYRRVELVAHGGWPAVARSEDAALLASFGHRWAGTWVDRVVGEYRRWPGQTSVSPADLAIRDLPHVRGWIAQRHAALDEVEGRHR